MSVQEASAACFSRGRLTHTRGQALPAHDREGEAKPQARGRGQRALPGDPLTHESPYPDDSFDLRMHRHFSHSSVETGQIRRDLQQK
eukprot:3002583-Pyramimonas_sp.AAC.1